MYRRNYLHTYSTCAYRLNRFCSIFNHLQSHLLCTPIRHIFAARVNSARSSELLLKRQNLPFHMLREKPGKPWEPGLHPKAGSPNPSAPTGTPLDGWGRMRKDHRARYRSSHTGEHHQKHHQDLLPPAHGALALPAQPNQGGWSQ